MMQKACLVCLILLCAGPEVVWAQQTSPEEVDVWKIWDRAPHNAFTDLVRFDGRFYCTFREGSGHVPGESGTDGKIRIIASEDGRQWRSVALLEKEGIDLRDPKLSITPQGRLMVTIGGSNYDGTELVNRQPYVVFSNFRGTNFEEFIPVEIDSRVSKANDWLWRVTWHEGSAYGVVYQANDNGEWGLHLVESTDGVHYSLVTSLNIEGHPNESTVRFLSDNRMVMVVRREGGNRKGFLGSSLPPYTDWAWVEVSHRLGGPNLRVLDDDTLVLATRKYGSDRYATIVGRLTREGRLVGPLEVPSAGDTSYPGLVVHDGKLWMSYYSSHEDKSSIYLTAIPLDRIKESH